MRSVKLALGLAAVFAIALAGATRNAKGQCELSCENTDDNIQDVIEQMADLGYGVATGHFEVYDHDNAVQSDVYIPFADRSVDYLVSHFDDGNTYTRIGGQDAIVFRGCTAPLLWNPLNAACPTPAPNYYMHPYNAVRIVQQNDENVPTETVDLNASLGDPFRIDENMLYGSNPSSAFPAPFDRKLNVAFSSDAQTLADLETAFSNADLVESVNLVGIPSDWFIFSESELDTPRDTLTLIYALDWGALPEDCVSCNKEIYLNQSFPFYIFYRDQVEPLVPLPLTLASTEPPKSQIKEAKKIINKFDQLTGEVADYLATMYAMQLVGDYPFSSDSSTLDGLSMVGTFDHGIECISQEVDCQFDTPMTHYWWDRNFHTLAGDDFFVVVGIDHTALGGAEFSKLGVYVEENAENGNAYEQLDVARITGLREDYGFIDLSLKKSLSDLPGLSFLYQVTRPENCIFDIAGLCPDTDALAADQPFMFRGDLTLNPATGTRPDPEQLVSWRLLHFKLLP